MTQEELEFLYDLFLPDIDLELADEDENENENEDEDEDEDEYLTKLLIKVRLKETSFDSFRDREFYEED